MLFPLNTDAPIYHFPVMVIGLIVVNILCFLLTGMGLEDKAELWQPWMLEYGSGLHPLQWLTSNFVHLGIFHLLGNMVFLWGFGLVVEGKLGWWRFLLVYLAIGVTQCAFEQTIMLGYDPADRIKQQMLELVEAELEEEGFTPEEIEEFVAEEAAQYAAFATPAGSCGASAILYGMLAISLVWAPKNEMTCMVLFFYRVFTFEVTIMAFALWYIGLEILMVTLSGFSVGSAALHVMGAIVGFGVGVLLLKRDWVDCENWDLFTVLSGNYGSSTRDVYGYEIGPQPKKKRKRKKKKRPKLSVSMPEAEAKLDEIRESIEADEFVTAAINIENLRMRGGQIELDSPHLKALANGLVKEREWSDAVAAMIEYVKRFPDDSARMRLRLGGVLLQRLREPAKTLKVFKNLDPAQLSREEQASLRKLLRAAKQQAGPR